jgi:uncharacterized protein
MNIARACLILAAALAAAVRPASAADPVRVLLVAGGHAFETNAFYETFRADTNLSVRTALHPAAHALWTAEAAKDWDVLVLYDMWQKIDDAAKANLLARLAEGKGLVVTHHAIADYQDWPEYRKIIGARYYLAATNVDGVAKARSTYRHGVDIPIHILDKDHPITRGLSDFVIHDETYKLFDVYPDAHPLAGTDHPDSGPQLVWVKTHGPARVVYIQLGHDHLAYENPNYRRLLDQAIRWAAKRLD